MNLADALERVRNLKSMIKSVYWKDKIIEMPSIFIINSIVFFYDLLPGKKHYSKSRKRYDTYRAINGKIGQNPEKPRESSPRKIVFETKSVSNKV